MCHPFFPLLIRPDLCMAFTAFISMAFSTGDPSIPVDGHKIPVAWPQRVGITMAVIAWDAPIYEHRHRGGRTVAFLACDIFVNWMPVM